MSSRGKKLFESSLRWILLFYVYYCFPKDVRTRAGLGWACSVRHGYRFSCKIRCCQINSSQFFYSRGYLLLWITYMKQTRLCAPCTAVMRHWINISCCRIPWYYRRGGCLHPVILPTRRLPAPRDTTDEEVACTPWYYLRDEEAPPGRGAITTNTGTSHCLSYTSHLPFYCNLFTYPLFAAPVPGNAVLFVAKVRSVSSPSTFSLPPLSPSSLIPSRADIHWYQQETFLGKGP